MPILEFNGDNMILVNQAQALIPAHQLNGQNNLHIHVPSTAKEDNRSVTLVKLGQRSDIDGLLVEHRIKTKIDELLAGINNENLQSVRSDLCELSTISIVHYKKLKFKIIKL